MDNIKGISDILNKEFELLAEPLELIQTLRTEERRHQLKKVQLSTWKKRS